MTEANLRLEEWLDDLCVRFIINLPEDDLKDIARICFQVEEAQWFYEDFIRPLDPSLPTMSLRTFCLRIFAHCPLLSPFSQGHHMRAFENFMEYKTRIPVRGAIMLNEAMDAVVLVKGWKKGASWSFPRGKIAKDEEDLTCAVREVYEETGLDLEAAGLVPTARDVKSIEVNMREQNMRLFVFRNMPMDTNFAPRTRKEISKIQWWPLSDLPAFRKKGNQQENNANISPNKFYMVAPFLVHLRKWVIEQKKRDLKDAKRTTSNQYLAANMSHDDFLTEEDQGAESAAHASTNEKQFAPELDTYDGASALLSRLVKIQPSTQGLQPEAAAQATNNAGSALLALLHSKPSAPSQPVPANVPPLTPMENVDANPSMPKTPHHYPPRPPPFSSMPPPPTFPVQQHDERFSHQIPNVQYSHQQQISMANSQQNRHVIHQNPPRPQESHYQPAHLIHPQPLPPHVQKAVFTGGLVHSPMIPQSMQQDPALQFTPIVSGNVNNPQFPGLHAPMVPPTIVQTPKLTSHSMALLNAFKSKEQINVAPDAADLPLRGYRSSPAVASAQPQELSAAEAKQPPQASHPPPIFVQPHIGILEKSALTPRQPISDSQKSALLGMFKSPTISKTSLAAPLSATALPTNGTPSAVELSAVEPLSSNAPTMSALLSDKRTPDLTRKSGSVPLLNPEANLPYHATAILSRPREKKAEPQQKTQPKSTNGDSTRPQNNGGHAEPRGHRHGKAPEPVKFQPQILKRPTVDSPRVPLSPTAPAISSATLLAHMSSARAPVQAKIEQPQAIGHQQTLLSLFAKAQTPTTTSPTRDTSSMSQMLPPLKAPARSRVGSLASGAEGSASRRGSQTPISPADKGFLLSYLDDAIAKGSGR